MRIIEHKRLSVLKNRTRLAFTTTGGSNWAIWDRFLSIDGKPAFHIGNVCGTGGFFFRHLAESRLSSFGINDLQTGLANGSADFAEVCGEFSAIIPAGGYEAVLFELSCRLVGQHSTPDYFATEQREAWREHDHEKEAAASWPYCRTQPWTIRDAERCFEFLIPLYPPSATDSKRVDQ